MSDMERNKGRLIPASLIQLHLEDNDPERLQEAGFIFIERYNQWYYVDYEVQGCTDMFFSEIEQVHGEIHFHTCHYNGGGDLSEVLNAELGSK